MSSEGQMTEAIKKQGLLPLFYHSDAEVCIDVVKILYASGITIIEFTNRGAAALENFKALATLKSETMPGLLLAAGTIKTSTEASAFVAAGADFLISPVFDKGVCDIAFLQKKLWIPGCMTPTEIDTAAKAGCKIIKLFPGNVLGPGFLNGIKPLFPHTEFMPTGGVEATVENIDAWFKAGVCAVGMGSNLIDPQIIEAKNYALLAQRLKQVKTMVDEVKSEYAQS